jgi:hypothetical protein
VVMMLLPAVLVERMVTALYSGVPRLNLDQYIRYPNWVFCNFQRNFQNNVKKFNLIHSFSYASLFIITNVAKKVAK